MIAENTSELTVWRLPPWAWAVVIAIVALVIAIFYDGLRPMVGAWSGKEEYGYGYLIPFITLFLIWQHREVLERMVFHGAWIGVGVTLLGIGLYFMGELTALNIIKQYAFLVVIAGLVLSFVGWQGFRLIWVPLLLLVFMIPLPYFLYSELSTRLQLISSELGVAVIRLFGISVYLEGNVIDLGSYKLQVVEACSGLRYLFPLATLSFIAAYLFKGAFWKKAVIFLSSMPITVFMNSFRIGVIGVLVEYGGISMAEGFLHYFEGWVIFMACMAILIAEMWLLARVGRERLSLSQVFAVELPAPTPKDARVQLRTLPKSFWVAGLVLAIALVPVYLIDEYGEILPPRADFSGFPMTLGTWHGKRDRIESIYLDVLKPHDYLLADFVNSEKQPVNLYIGFHAYQLKVSSPHSPRACLPAGGWLMKDISQMTLDGIRVGDNPLRINRVVIQKGDYKQLVYYWFQQRGRNLTNEYIVKWYLFWDALTRKRTDGALVRLTAFIKPGEDLEEADRRLVTFAKEINGSLREYIPD